MIVVTGGVASGKKTFLEDCGVDLTCVFDARDSQASTVSLADAAVVFHVEELVREGALARGVFEQLLSKQVLTCTEVGSGVIPLTWDDRQFRERAGSLSSSLAKEADCVVRMVCGIPVVLKGVLPVKDCSCA